jgi:hypothetical protein
MGKNIEKTAEEKERVLSEIKKITNRLTLINLYRLKYFGEGLLNINNKSNKNGL